MQHAIQNGMVRSIIHAKQDGKNGNSKGEQDEAAYKRWHIARDYKGRFASPVCANHWFLNDNIAKMHGHHGEIKLQTLDFDVEHTDCNSK